MVRHHKTITRLVSTQAFQGSRVFVPTRASRTNNSTHSYPRVSREFFQPGFPGLVTQPTKGFQRIFPTKASRASNSTQVITRLLERFSNQGFQQLVTQPKLRKHENQPKQNKEINPKYPWLSKKWQG